jgi:hypothetical protein
MADDSKKDEDGIDYRPEGRNSGKEKSDPTDRGYDEAAHSGQSAYGVGEGAGGVFGTTGGGSYAGGMHVVERPVIRGTERGPDEVEHDGESWIKGGGRGKAKRP